MGNSTALGEVNSRSRKMDEERKIWDMVLEKYDCNRDDLMEILLDIQKC